MIDCQTQKVIKIPTIHLSYIYDVEWFDPIYDSLLNNEDPSDIIKDMLDYYKKYLNWIDCDSSLAWIASANNIAIFLIPENASEAVYSSLETISLSLFLNSFNWKDFVEKSAIIDSNTTNCYLLPRLGTAFDFIKAGGCVKKHNGKYYLESKNDLTEFLQIDETGKNGTIIIDDIKCLE